MAFVVGEEDDCLMGGNADPPARGSGFVARGRALMGILSRGRSQIGDKGTQVRAQGAKMKVEEPGNASGTQYSDPSRYWEERLTRNFDLTRAGHANLGPRYNAMLYRLKRDALDRAFHASRVEVGGAKVLDVGCGTGFYTGYFSEKGAAKYIGIDLTKVSVMRLRQAYPAFSFSQMDISTERLASGETFDIVLCADVLFHIIDDNGFEAAIRNMSAAIVPGGILVVSDFFSPVATRLAEHVHLRSRREYWQVFQEVGLAPQLLEPISCIMHPPPRIPNGPRGWKMYARLWELCWRVEKLNWVDHLAPSMLGPLDARLVRMGLGARTVNLKWLVAKMGDDA